MLYGIIVIIRVIIICAPTREASGWRSVGSTRAGSRFRGVRFPRTKGGPRISRSEDSYCAKFLLCEVEVFVLDMFILHTSARGVCVCVCAVLMRVRTEPKWRRSDRGTHYCCIAIDQTLYLLIYGYARACSEFSESAAARAILSVVSNAILRTRPRPWQLWTCKGHLEVDTRSDSGGTDRPAQMHDTTTTNNNYYYHY